MASFTAQGVDGFFSRFEGGCQANMRNENFRIPLIASLIFLLISIFGQWIFGLLGGFLVYALSTASNIKTSKIDWILMLVIGFAGIIWFARSKSYWGKWLASCIVLFGTCNAILFYSYGHLTHYFYPDRYIFGSIISASILSTIGFFKTRLEKKPKQLTWAAVAPFAS